MEHEGKICFVMVGSTRFDALIEAVDEPEIGAALRAAWNISKTVCQIGRGTYEPKTCRFFEYTSELDHHIARASLVISHGGAGSTIQTLKQGKPLITVNNDQLMDNH
jgi:beta-1,4-N-acetylglucosaminyltransferase